MPVKMRAAKRRLDPGAELKAWSLYFQSGHDYLGDLPEIGVPTGPYHDPDRVVGEEVWHRLGARFLEEAADPLLGTPWALREFGEPHAR